MARLFLPWVFSGSRYHDKIITNQHHQNAIRERDYSSSSSFSSSSCVEATPGLERLQNTVELLITANDFGRRELVGYPETSFLASAMNFNHVARHGAS